VVVEVGDALVLAEVEGENGLAATVVVVVVQAPWGR
jgi:hypothetical protein